MKHQKRIIITFILVCLCLVGCQVTSKTDQPEGEYDGFITFGAPNQFGGDGVLINENNAIINKGGQYVLSGQSQDGQIIVDALEEDIQLIFDNLELTCQNNSPIFIKNARSVTIQLIGESHLSDTKNYLLNKEGASAVIYSNSDLIFKGDGKLNVNANYQNAIETTDHLLIQSGQYDIDSIVSGFVSKNQMIVEKAQCQIESKGNGIRAKVLSVKDGTFTIDSKQSAIVAEDGDISQGTWNITSLMNGFTIDNGLIWRDGILNITTQMNSIEAGQFHIYQGAILLNTQGTAVITKEDFAIYGGNLKVENSQVALKVNTVLINDGTLNLMSLKDGIQVGTAESTGTCTITNGNIIMDNGEYAFNINGKMIVNGGTTYANGSINKTQPAIICSGGYQINGGIFCSLDNTNQKNIPAPDSLQTGIIFTVSQSMPAGTSVMIKDNTDSNVFEYTSLKGFTTIHLSSYKFTLGETYSLYINNTFYGEVTLDTNYPYYIY